jgi:hypothetical protein
MPFCHYLKLSLETALSLYRQLLRYGQTLRLTDKQYFSKRIRSEYDRHKNLSDSTLIYQQIIRGEELLKRNRFL